MQWKHNDEPFLTCFCSYNSALAVPPSGWSVPARPQPWFPQHPAVPLPPAVPMGLTQQPLFPIESVKPSLSSSTSPALQPPFQITPPGLPSSASLATVSQPLFPISANTNTPTQSLPFIAPVLSATIPPSSSTELRSSIDTYSSANTSISNNYHAPGIQGLNSPFLSSVVCLVSLIFLNWAGIRYRNLLFLMY